MATALISALTRRPVRADVAMTGEITLRGRVLPIGGLKDKTLAAHRAGIRRLIAPLDNKQDIAKLPPKVASEMTFHWVENMDQVIAEALDFSEQVQEIDPSLRDQLTTEQPPVADLSELPVEEAATDL